MAEVSDESYVVKVGALYSTGSLSLIIAWTPMRRDAYHFVRRDWTRDHAQSLNYFFRGWGRLSGAVVGRARVVRLVRRSGGSTK